MGLLYTIQIGLIVLWNYSEHKWFRKYLLKFHTWPVAQLITDDLDTLFCFILGQFGMENRIFLKCSIHDKFYWGNIIDINSVLKYFATHDSIIFCNKSVILSTRLRQILTAMHIFRTLSLSWVWIQKRVPGDYGARIGYKDKQGTYFQT